MPWTTLLRAPRMDAKSGAWLEGLSKRDAQAVLIVLPWGTLSAAVVLSLTVIVLRSLSWQTPAAGIEHFAYLVMAGVCIGYLPIALVWDHLCCCRCCCWHRPCRNREGWLALLPVAAFAVSSLLFWNSYVESRQLRKGAEVHATLVVVHGSLWFRLAASIEFWLQLAWLAAADKIRYEGGIAPQWKVWGRRLLATLWLLTFYGPLSAKETPLLYHHVLVLTGYAARVIVFLYCLAHVSRSCMRYCCGSYIGDWKVLDHIPCTPGRHRLHYLTYYLLTRPPFLLLVNLPLGYPLEFGAVLTSMVRCCFAILLAIVLGPAPGQALERHSLEEETQQQFDAGLALRCCDYANETYHGPPLPGAVVISGSAIEALNGTYERDFSSRDALSALTYIRHVSGPLPSLELGGLSSVISSAGSSAQQSAVEAGTADLVQFYLRKVPGDEWEISVSPTFKAGIRLAHVSDKATSPDRITGEWFELQGEEVLPNLEMHVAVEPSCHNILRRFEKTGACAQTDAHWLLVEEEDVPNAAAKLGPLQEEEEDAEKCRSLAQSRSVSIIVSFRGTSSMQNLVADARIAMEPLPRRTEGSGEGGGRSRGTETCTEALANISSQQSGGRASLAAVKAVQPLDLEQIAVELRRRELAACERQDTETQLASADAARSGADTPDVRSGMSTPLAAPATPIAARARSASTSSSSSARDSGGTSSRSFCSFCRLLNFLGRLCCSFCLLLLCPFLPSKMSDVEDDDEDFHEATLERVRVHRGFSQIYASIREEVMDLVQDRLHVCRAESRSVRIYVTGHSLGGAIASLFALDLATLLVPSAAARSDIEAGHAAGSKVVEAGVQPIVYTFGSPRLGNAAFRSIYNVLVPDTFRLVASRDLVPSLPPSISYRQLGREVWMDTEGELTFTMSWAMRQILPPRDSISNHTLLNYYQRLGKAFRKLSGKEFVSVFHDEPFMRGAFDQ